MPRKKTARQFARTAMPNHHLSKPEWDSRQIILTAEDQTPRELREVYEAIAAMLFHAWQARYEATDSREIFKDNVAIPLNATIRQATARMKTHELWLATNATGSLTTFQKALQTASDVDQSCGHYILSKGSEATPQQFMDITKELDASGIVANTKTAILADVVQINARVKNPPPMTLAQEEVYKLLDALAPGKAMKGPEIIRNVKGLEQSTLTSRIIPVLKEHYHVKNRPGAGYYIDKTA